MSSSQETDQAYSTAPRADTGQSEFGLWLSVTCWWLSVTKSVAQLLSVKDASLRDNTI